MSRRKALDMKLAHGFAVAPLTMDVMSLAADDVATSRSDNEIRVYTNAVLEKLALVCHSVCHLVDTPPSL